MTEQTYTVTPHARLEALASSLTTITAAKPDTDMSGVLPVIDVVLTLSDGDRHGATTASDLLAITNQLLNT